ncbi:MAG: hypothetical protein QM762_24880 [Chryseolinea sp.]
MKNQPSESTISIVPPFQINAQPKLYNSLASTFLDFFAKPNTPTYDARLFKNLGKQSSSLRCLGFHPTMKYQPSKRARQAQQTDDT